MVPMPNPLTLWTNVLDEDLTVKLIQETLQPVQDDLWTAAACFDRLVNDIDVQRTLLELGIERTRSAVDTSREALTFLPNPIGTEASTDGGFNSTEKSETQTQTRYDALIACFRDEPANAQLCQIRVVLLERLDRLNTYVEICKGASEDSEDEVDEEWLDDPWVDGEAEPTSTPTAKISSSKPPITLSAFLTDDLLSSACVFVSHEWFAAVRILFQRHSAYLWPYRFTIQDTIPEHANPSKYRDLLPTFDVSTNYEQRAISDAWRTTPDWSETSEVRAVVERYAITLNTPLPPDIPSDTISRLPEVLTATELATWYKSRVDHIISSTGLVDTALAIIQHGASQGIPDLDEDGEALSLLYRLIYDSPQAYEYDADDDWTLSKWNSMDPLAVVRAYLRFSTPESVAKDISRLVIPYLLVLESRAERANQPDPSLPNRILYDYILSAPLEVAAAIFEASKPTLPPAQRLISSDEDIARLALACLYGSDSLDEWPTMSRIFECLPAWDIAQERENDDDIADTTVASLGAFVAPSTTRTRCTPSDLLVFFKPLPSASLSRALDILDVHLESGEILSRWSVPAPLRWFLQSNDNAGEQRSWANRMARRAGGQEDQLNAQDDWAWLLEDMLKLSGKGESGLRGAFGLLSRDEVKRIFLGGLLSTGKFTIAKELLHSHKSKLNLDSEVIEDICIACSHEFYDNASSGNYNTGEMKLAYDCLDVPPPSNRLTAEKEFIEATSRLSSFNIMSRPGIPISPIEIRLTKDRLSLISRVLSSNIDAYKHAEVILDLVYKLGFRNDLAAEVKTLAMLADTALQAEDFERAYEISERMVDTVLMLRSSTILGIDNPKTHEATEVCWVACFQLGRQPEFDDLDKKLSLLGHTLELCPADKLHDVLVAWRRLEKDDIERRQERLSRHRSGVAPASAPRRNTSAPSKRTVTSSLAAQLQNFHMPSPPLLSTPDAAALASRTFRSVTANFPFSVGGRSGSPSSQEGERARSGSRRRPDNGDVSAQATRAFSKGIGWLIGDDT